MKQNIKIMCLILFLFACDKNNSSNINDIVEVRNILSIRDQIYSLGNDAISVAVHLVSEDEIAYFEIVLSDEPDIFTGVDAVSSICDNLESLDIGNDFKISGVFVEPLSPGEHVLVVADYLTLTSKIGKTTDEQNHLILENKLIKVGTNSVSIVSATIDEGTDEATIAVQMDNADLVRGFQFNISSDAPLGDPGIAAGADLPVEFMIAGNSQENGSFKVMAYVIGATDVQPGSNHVIDLTFSGLAEYPQGIHALTFSSGILSNGVGEAIDCEWYDGTLTIATPVGPRISFSSAILKDSNGKELEVETQSGIITLQ